MTDQEKLQVFVNEYSQLSHSTIANISELNEDQLLDYVEQREYIVNEMKAYRSLITDEMKTRINELIIEESIIVERMLKIKDEASEWLEKRGNIRSQQNAYQQPYSANSAFIDYRK
ncbi:hypothetical protein [Paenibacillus taichungensis]|uniref:hypothetical protein n=1 Tax=Paenibacillus taichungensis TaxID=484184 RepID=UPI0039A5A494